MEPLGYERDRPPYFAGRKRELRELSCRLDYIRATSDPAGGMVLIDGVQGAGKTQLLAEFVARAKAADAQVAHLDMTTADIPTTAKEMVGEIGFALSLPKRKVLGALDGKPKLKGVGAFDFEDRPATIGRVRTFVRTVDAADQRGRLVARQGVDRHR